MTESSVRNHAPHKADKEYWGLMAICRRMKWKHSRTPVRQALNHGFPLYLRTRAGQTRQFYYSSERLIASWEWSRCEREIERLLQNTPATLGAHVHLPIYEEPSRDLHNM